MRLNDNGNATLEAEGLTCDPDKKTKEYKVTLADFDQGQYVTDPEKIDKDIANDLKERTTAAAKAFAADHGNLKTPVLIGICYFSVKEGANLNDYYPHTDYVYSIEDNDSENEDDSETLQTHYILVKAPAVVEQVENHGKEDVLENPGSTIQSFNKDADGFSASWFEDMDDVKLGFKSAMDSYDLQMDQNLKDALSWID